MSVAPFQVGDLIQVPDKRIGQTVVDDVFDPDTAACLKQSHPVGTRCDALVAHDPGDNLIVICDRVYYYWDHESDELIRLGSEPEQFVTAGEM